MFKKAMAIVATITAFSASTAEAALLDYSYTFRDGRSIKGSFYGDVSADDAMFYATGSRFYSREPNRGVVGGPTTVKRALHNAPAEIALDKSYIDLSIQMTAAAFPAVIFGVGEGTDPRRALGYDAVSNNDLFWEEFDPSKLFIEVLKEATLGFTYRNSQNGRTVTGMLSGWVTQDRTRFEVGKLTSMNGMDVSTDLATWSNDGFAPVVLMDKTKVDFFASSNRNDPYGASETYLRMNEGTLSSRENPKGTVFASADLDGERLYFSDFNAADLTLRLEGEVAAVPEPATWAMMIAGFGLLGGTMRRRPRQARYA